MLFAVCLDAVLACCETFDDLKGPPGGEAGFVATAAGAGGGGGGGGAGFDFGGAPVFGVVGLRAADLVVEGFVGDLLETETAAFGAGNFAAAAAAADLDDAGAGAGAGPDGFAIAPVAFFDDGFGAVGPFGAAAAISFLAPAPVSFFFTTLPPPPRIGYGIFTVPPPPPAPPTTPSSPKGLFAVGTLGPGAFV